MAMVGQGSALCVPGNHEAKLLRKLRGKDVRISHGLQETLDQLARLPILRVGRSRTLSTRWSVTMSSMTASWWWRTPG